MSSVFIPSKVTLKFEKKRFINMTSSKTWKKTYVPTAFSSPRTRSCFRCIFFATFQTFRGNIDKPWMLKEVKVNGAIKADYIKVFFGLLLLVFLQICYNGCTCKSKLQCNFLSVNMSKKMHFISSSSFTNWKSVWISIQNGFECLPKSNSLI